MGEEARNHHYIPQGYLRGFGWKKGKNWYVYAADLQKQTYFQPNVRNVCAERDFMRIEVDGHEPNKLEKELGKFEGAAREAIVNIERTKSFEGEDKNIVLNFMALLAVRNPQMRENMRNFHERVLRQVMSLTLATKERWESQVRQAKQNGVNLGEEVSYERMKEFHQRGEYTIETRREMHIASELNAHDTVLQTLGARKWKLFHALPDEGFFVTSNHPVVLTWNNPDKVPPMMRHSPGFGMIDTEVIFPLTHTCGLLGRFEGMEDGIEGAYGGLIAAFNTRMFSHAAEYLFMREKSFPYFVPPQIGYHDDKFIERAKEYRERHPPQEEDVVEWSAEEGPPIPKAMPMPERESRWKAAGFRKPGESREES